MLVFPSPASIGFAAATTRRISVAAKNVTADEN
jgi:hypothetical protein